MQRLVAEAAHLFSYCVIFIRGFLNLSGSDTSVGKWVCEEQGWRNTGRRKPGLFIHTYIHSMLAKKPVCAKCQGPKFFLVSITPLRWVILPGPSMNMWTHRTWGSVSAVRAGSSEHEFIRNQNPNGETQREQTWWRNGLCFYRSDMEQDCRCCVFPVCK